MSEHLLPALVAVLAVVSVGLLLTLIRLSIRSAAARRKLVGLNDLLRTVQPALFFTVDSASASRPLRYVSAGAAAALGRSAEDLTGNPIRMFVRRGDTSAIQHLMDSVTTTGRPALIETALMRADGSELPVLMSVYPAGQGGQGRDMLIAAVDSAGRNRSGDEARRALLQQTHSEKLRSLEILAGGVAHDFNNLLVGVLGTADLALMDLSPLSPARGSIEAIKAAAVQASELTRQMLSYSGRGHFLVERIDLNATLRSMAPLLKASVGGKVSVRYRLADDLPPIEADVTQIRQLLVSLTTNASDSIGNRTGEVAVRTHAMRATRSDLAAMYVDEDLPEGEYVCLEVSDDGCGMDAESQARVFDPFFSTKTYGRGFGLATVLSIVRGHKGAIRVDSTVGKGTSFTMLFPASERDRRAAGTPAPEEDSGAAAVSGTVLVIDDDASVRQVTEGMLSRMGARVLKAESGAKGVELLREHGEAVDLILLNMTMPGMSGLETVRLLRAVRPDVKVVLCTGYGERATRETFRDEGLTGYLQKPFLAADLNLLLRRVLGRPRSLTERSDAEEQP